MLQEIMNQLVRLILSGQGCRRAFFGFPLAMVVVHGAFLISFDRLGNVD